MDSIKVQIFLKIIVLIIKWTQLLERKKKRKEEGLILYQIFPENLILKSVILQVTEEFHFQLN